MGHDGLRQLASLADEMGISHTFGLQGVRYGSMSPACTVRARRFGSRLVPAATSNVDRRGQKPCKPSEPSEMQSEGGLAVQFQFMQETARARNLATQGSEARLG
jgi:hypothetical protein